jgi:transposase
MTHKAKGETAMTKRTNIYGIKFIVDGVKERAAKGMTAGEIAIDMGMPISMARGVISTNGIEVVSRRVLPGVVDRKEVRSRAVAILSESGMTAREIGIVVGVSAMRIYQIRQENKLPHAEPDPVPAAPAPAAVEIRSTIRQTAIANKGKASASEIAKACGVSRNSIIGHWGRAKQTGELVAAE